MNSKERRQQLEEKHIELQLKQNKDVLYMRILISFGTVSIFISAIMLLMFESSLYSKTLAMLIIGVFLLVTGLIWQYRDEKQLEEVSEDVQEYRDRDLSVIKSK